MPAERNGVPMARAGPVVDRRSRRRADRYRAGRMPDRQTEEAVAQGAPLEAARRAAGAR